MLTLGPLEFDVPAVMGILNVTPDSFSDGGRFTGHEAALRQATTMARDGAAIIDVGGESTRPGAADVSEQEELDRVLPVIEAVVAAVDVPVSIDTSKPSVMRAAVAAGASMINDIRALREDGALQAAVELGCPVCLMHMQGKPRTMQQEPVYGDVVKPRHNIELLSNLRQLQSVGRPILAGLSRKSTLGELTGRGVGERLPASIAAAVIAVIEGATIVRVHDVRETVDALRVAAAVLEWDGD
jgi:dihydropteroate synthase